MIVSSTNCNSPPNFTFIHGILIGQGSIFILIIFLLKYVVFEDPEVFRKKLLLKNRDKINLNSNKLKKLSSQQPFTIPILPSPHITTSKILSTLTYDLSNHPPESLDWLNILNAQMLSAYRNLILQSRTGNGGAKGLMEEILNRASGNENENENSNLGGGEGIDGDEESNRNTPGLIGVDRIKVGEVELGDKFPILSNARVRPSSSEDGTVRIELDLDYTDHVSLSLSTSILINFPRPRFAILPISLSLTLSRFSGTLTLELPHLSPPTSIPTSNPSLNSPHPILHFSLHPDFTLNISITSQLGSRAKLQDIPKVEQLILGRIRGWIQDRVVWPGRVEVALPGLFEEVIREALFAADGVERNGNGNGKGEGVDGLEGEDWEWVEGSSIEDEEEEGGNDYGRLPNADSDDGGGYEGYEDEEDRTLPGYSPTLSRARPRFAKSRKEEEEGEASLDLTADGGPSVYLRPKIRKRPLLNTSRGSSSVEDNNNLGPNPATANLFNFPINNNSPMLAFNNNHHNLPPPPPISTFTSNTSSTSRQNENGTPSLMPWELELERPISPTESLPGFFRIDNNLTQRNLNRDMNRDELNSNTITTGVNQNKIGIGGGGGLNGNGKGIYANRNTNGSTTSGTGSGGGGMRYRAAGGLGVGVGVQI